MNKRRFDYIWRIVENQENGNIPFYVLESNYDNDCCSFDCDFSEDDWEKYYKDNDNEERENLYIIQDFAKLLSITIPTHGLNEKQLQINFNTKTKKLNIIKQINPGKNDEIIDAQIEDMQNIYNKLDIPLEDYSIDLTPYLKNRKIKTSVKMFYQEVYPGTLTIYIPFLTLKEEEDETIIPIEKR